MLADEYGTASNIKSRVNRLSVLSAITATQQRLKLYNKGTVAPPVRVHTISSSSKWSGRLLRHDHDRRRKRKESHNRFRAFQANQHFSLPLRQQVPY